MDQKQLFKKLQRYYDNNSNLYENELDSKRYGKFIRKAEGLTTCVNRSTEFYVSKILPDLGKVKITSDNKNLQKSISQIWTWSNFYASKQISSRNLSLLGNLFWKANSDGEKVWFEVIKPEIVTSFKSDNRGFLTEIRLDIPVVDDNGFAKTQTEFWSKTDDYYAIWIHNLGENAELEKLDSPMEMGFLEELGIDFVPFVHCKFKDVGDPWGVGCVGHALSKTDESNILRSRLHSLLFKYGKGVIAVSANGEDKDGRPKAPPKLKTDEDKNPFEDDTLTYLPGVSRIDSLIPDINYGDALAIANAQDLEIEKDLPELRYYSMSDTQLSGKALKLILGAAIDRAVEARSNLIQGLVRINQMCLSIGAFWGLWSGSYDSGDFDHDILLPDMFPQDDSDKAELLKNLTISGMALATALRIAGYSDEFIAQALQEKQTQDTQTTANKLNAFNTI